MESDGDDSRYTGEFGNENLLDDYLFGPLFLMGVIGVFALAGGYLTNNILGTVAGTAAGVTVAVWLVRMEWKARGQTDE